MASDHAKYDNLLFQIIEKEGQLVPFLDVIFSFLYRRTDFYKIQHDPSEKMGFPLGVSEQFVKDAFLRYHTLAMQDEERYQTQLLLSKNTGAIPPVAQTVEITNEKPKPIIPKRKVSKNLANSSESYNGAVRENYSWSQTVTDVDIHIKVPEHVKSGRLVSITVTNSHLKVACLDKNENGTNVWNTIIDDDLIFKVNGEDAVWSLIPGEEIFISLEKSQERWWDALLKSEPKIDTEMIDNTRPYEDLDSESIAKIDEIMYNEKLKSQGKLTTEQMKVEKALKESWNIDGSPFKGQAYDPSFVTQVVGNLKD